MTTDIKLLPCPFCGANAHFEVDDARWEWVECESCGMQSNRRASLMEDCKPMLAEAWNTRAKWGQPAHSGEPVGYLYCGGSYGDELADWEIVAEQLQCDRLNEHHGALGKEAKLPLYTAPQPVEREPLPVSQIRDWWASENGLEDCEMCKLTDFLRVVRAVEEKHGIKGGQHGADT